MGWRMARDHQRIRLGKRHERPFQPDRQSSPEHPDRKPDCSDCSRHHAATDHAEVRHRHHQGWLGNGRRLLSAPRRHQGRAGPHLCRERRTGHRTEPQHPTARAAFLPCGQQLHHRLQHHHQQVADRGKLHHARHPSGCRSQVEPDPIFPRRSQHRHIGQPG